MHFTGFSIHLSDAGVGTGPTRFTLSGRTRLGTDPFTDPTTSDATFLGDPIRSTTNDLGYTADIVNHTAVAAAAGTYALMTLTITPAATLAGGTYTIGYSSDSVLGTASADSAYVNATPYSVTVTATPEPATLGLLALGSLGLLGRRRNAT